MQLHIETAWIAAVLLVSIRLGAVFIMTPVFGSMQLPARIRVLMVLALSASLVSAAGTRTLQVPTQLGDLVVAALGELMLGALFAFGLFAGFAAFLFGGRLLDMQMGLGVASLIDPATRSQAPLLGTLFNMLAVMLFFALDGHHLLIRAMAYSLQRFPPGAFNGRFDVTAVVAMFGSMFTFGFALVAPVVFALFLIDVGMAVMSRTMPQVNIFNLAVTLKIFVGLMMLAWSVQYMAPLIHRIFAAIFGYWERVVDNG
jgi:flagellar biosynthesis protein FliR